MPADELAHWLQSWTPDASWVQETPMSPQKISLVFAAIEHGTWVATMLSYLRGERMAPPPLDPHQCNFSRWFDGMGPPSQATLAVLPEINHLHQQIHALGQDMADLRAIGQTAEALAKYPRMEQLRDALLLQLHVLARA
jgi:hypothetical protein